MSYFFKVTFSERVTWKSNKLIENILWYDIKVSSNYHFALFPSLEWLNSKYYKLYNIYKEYKFFFFFYFLKICGIVVLQCCVSFCCATKWISSKCVGVYIYICIYIYIYPLPLGPPPSPTPLGHHRAPCAKQHVPTSYLFYTWQCIGRAESQLLDHQGSPGFIGFPVSFFYFLIHWFLHFCLLFTFFCLLWV